MTGQTHEGRMGAGDLGSHAEFVRTEECPTPSYPVHRLEVWAIGSHWFGLCQHCGRHKAIAQGSKPWTWLEHDTAIALQVNPTGSDY